MPATFGKEEEVTTLAITCEDKAIGLTVVLEYSVFTEVDAIARSVKVMNTGSQPMVLDKVMSGCLDMDNQDFEMITLHGSWARERHIERKKLGHGKHSVSSQRGETSHQEHPFMALVEKNTTQTLGEVYGFHFVYSGTFVVHSEVNHFDSFRVLMVIAPAVFSGYFES